MKYVIGGFGLVVIVSLFVFLMFVMLGGDDDETQPSEETIVLSEQADSGSEVVFTTYGPIVANEEFTAIRIIVSSQERRYQLLEGYSLAVTDEVRLSNTTSAYESFLFALENAHFTAVRGDQPEREDGRCPTTRRHVYRMSIDDEEVLRTWASPCRGERGSFGGEMRLVERLFQAQIPDYRDLTRGIRL